MKKVTTLLVAFCATTALWAGNFTAAAFTVSADGKQVYFSQGNLQCSGVASSDYTWSFAENQYDMLGTANVSGSDLADKIDLFGWSANNETAKWGISTSTSNDDYAGDFVDWGTNTIGTTAPNTYRTLTKDEWKYLLDTRTDAGDKKGVARIKLSDAEYANGLILLPDIWNCPDGIEFKNGLASASSEQAYADHQTFTLADWQKLEAAGAVFLPASGYRSGSTVAGVQTQGHYWSATPNGSNYACALGVSSGGAGTYDAGERKDWRAVRLVQDLYAVNIAATTNGTVAADKTTALAGEIVTLTLSTNDAYYALKTITVMQGEMPITTTAVEGTTNQYTFTMPQGEVTVSAVFEKIASAFTPAAFSIAAGKQVYFSQGNLQCSGVASSNYTWSFAENQYDMLGTDNISGGNLADKIDLFGWSANNETAKWGISTSADNNDYSGDFVDWGKNIGNGTTYRTLTHDEWSYLLNYRTNASEKYGVACIKLSDTEYANGLILLPDSWDGPADVEFKSGAAKEWGVDAYATHQTFTLAQWQQLEDAGAVFLPASGYRYGSNVNSVKNSGYYWPATPFGSDNAFYQSFFSNGVYPNYGDRYRGQAVRLVQDVYAVNIAAAENGTVEVDKIGALEGETVTITVTPNEGYEVESITVTYGDNQTVEVSAENTFTMPAGNVTITVVFKSSTAIKTIEMLNLRTENGSIIYDGEFQIFDLLGRNVTRMNGSLYGVYIVKVGDKAQKISVSRK